MVFRRLLGMNFLAHLYLSGTDDDIRLGNFFADAVKGNQLDRYPEKVQMGIRLHRHIDHYTDNHPVVKASIKRLQPVYGRYSGIITDIYYDHYLAADWDDYHDTPLYQYTRTAYKLLVRNYFLLPDRSRRILPFMITYNWLYGYANLKDLDQVFDGMSRRTRFPEMKNAVSALKENYEDFRDDFTTFFPDLVKSSKEFISVLEQES